MKWLKRCFGWIVLGCALLAALGAYINDLRIGHGTVELRLKWQEKDYPVARVANRKVELIIAGKQQTWLPGKVLKLRPGSTELELRVAHFKPCTTRAHVSKNAQTFAEFHLEAEPGTITIQNLKRNAVVNGELCGPTWVLKDAEVGRIYAIEAAAPGYHTNRVNLHIENPGEEVVTNLAWMPLMALVRVGVDAPLGDMNIALDGTSVDLLRGGSVEVGSHTLSVSNSQYYPYAQPIIVVYGVSNSFQVHLTPKPARLKIQVSPAIAYELQDDAGGVIAMQQGVAEVTPGSKSLRVVSKGFASSRRDFVMAPNGNYSWQVQLEPEGLQDFKKNMALFDSLTSGTNRALLERSGGGSWARIRDMKFDGEYYPHGAQQYAQACDELTVILDSATALEKWRDEFRLLSSDNSNADHLDKFGGIDWQHIRGITPDADNVVKAAQQFKESCDRLQEIIKTLPERGRLWTNEIRQANAIDYWNLMNDLARAKAELAIYEDTFGPNSDFDRWFGGAAGKIQTWTDSIEAKERYSLQRSKDNNRSAKTVITPPTYEQHYIITKPGVNYKY